MSRVIVALLSALLVAPGCGSKVAGSDVEHAPVQEERGSGLMQPDVVVRYGAAELVLTPWTASWESEPNARGEVEGTVADGIPPDPLPDLGVVDGEITLIFPREGWTFEAWAHRVGEECAQEIPAAVVTKGGREWGILLAGPPDRYAVSVSGNDATGSVVVSFAVTTVSGRPMPAPEAWATVFYESDGKPEASTFDLRVSYLAFTPELAAARLTIEAADGKVSTFDLAPATDLHEGRGCVTPGSVVLETSAPQGRVVEEIGPGPYELRWELTLDDRSFMSEASWPTDLDPDTFSIPLVFTPDLPGMHP